MKYEKPTIALVAPAIDAVQSSLIKQLPPHDNSLQTTVAAYQSDEE